VSGDYEKRKNAQEWIAEKITKHNGKSSEEAHRESAKIAREQDAKNANKPTKKKGG